MVTTYTRGGFLQGSFIGYNEPWYMYKRWAPPSNKRQLKKLLFWLKKAKTWQLLLIVILLLFVAATFLRLNNIGMVERRNAVYEADKQGDKVLIQQRLVALQQYVSSHMNTSLGQGIYLKESYARDREAAISAAANAQNPQSEVYQKASVECRARFQGGTNSFRNDYVTCVQEAVNNLSPEEQAATHLPDPASYHYNFTSPIISFDTAGLATIFILFLTGVVTVRLLLLHSVRLLLKYKKTVI
jgi:hypothetical protein